MASISAAPAAPDRRPSTRPPVVAVVGIDGSGKSTVFRGTVECLGTSMKVEGIGEHVWSGAPGTPVIERDDVPLSHTARLVGSFAKTLRRPELYKVLKFLELSERARIEDDVARDERPDLILTDGHPLVNFAAWAVARYYRDQLAHNDEELCRALLYLTGQPVPWRALPVYMPRAWQVVLVSRTPLVRFHLPDMVILLDVDPATAMKRIEARGLPLQAHESTAFLGELREAYMRVCTVLEERFGCEVYRLKADCMTADEIVHHVATAAQEFMMSTRITESIRNELNEIDVIATTMSGSFQDQQKIPSIGPQFVRRTSRPVHVYPVDTHAEAQRVAQDVVSRGGRILVSAGGGGTFNAVLEGCLIDGSAPQDLRLAFLRKGSADLIGKVLAIPDTLDGAVDAIVEGIESDRCVPMDVLSVETEEPDGSVQHRHMVGFGGLGAFGEVPRISESRIIKYYKGLLGSLFGDLGPFAVALTLAAISWRVRRALGRISPTVVELDDEAIGPEIYPAIVIMNGDLGDDFPLGRGLALGSGTFRVVVLRYRGLVQALRQVAACRDASILSAPDRYDAIIRTVRHLTVRPLKPLPTMVNVDSLRLPTRGTVCVSISGTVQVIAGKDSAMVAMGPAPCTAT